MGTRAGCLVPQGVPGGLLAAPQQSCRLPGIYPCGSAAVGSHSVPWSPQQPPNCARAAVWAAKLIQGKNNTGKTKQVIFNPSQSRDLQGTSVNLPRSRVSVSCFTGVCRQTISCTADKLVYLSSSVPHLTALKSVHLWERNRLKIPSHPAIKLLRLLKFKAVASSCEALIFYNKRTQSR